MAQMTRDAKPTISNTRCPICGANNRKRERKLIDAIFEYGLKQVSDDLAARKEFAHKIANQLRYLGFDIVPMGSSRGVLK